ncbi:hypothetical protein [Tabrizicola soli]
MTQYVVASLSGGEEAVNIWQIVAPLLHFTEARRWNRSSKQD